MDNGPNTDQSKRSGDWGRPNYPFMKKIKSLDGWWMEQNHYFAIRLPLSSIRF
jgi:hypothetical protein